MDPHIEEQGHKLQFPVNPMNYASKKDATFLVSFATCFKIFP